MTKMNGRNHNVTFGVGCIVTCIVLLLFFLNKTHEKLENSRRSFLTLQDKYGALTKQFESLFEYKERLEASFMNFKQTKSSIISETDTLKSELAVLKSSHRTEIQRLHDELDACRRREEMAVVHRDQKDEALLSPASLTAQSPSVPILFTGGGGGEERMLFKDGGSGSGGVKVISSLKHHQTSQTSGKDHTDKGPPQPSMDPNIDPVGNVFV